MHLKFASWLWLDNGRDCCKGRSILSSPLHVPVRVIGQWCLVAGRSREAETGRVRGLRDAHLVGKYHLPWSSPAAMGSLEVAWCRQGTVLTLLLHNTTTNYAVTHSFRFSDLLPFAEFRSIVICQKLRVLDVAVICVGMDHSTFCLL